MTPTGVIPAIVALGEGVIVAVEPWRATGSRADWPGLEDFGELAILPGVIDTHVHVNEPGRADWEGFASATRAAAAGGVTTLVDMPLNSIPATTDVEALEAKRRAATGKCAVDVGFWGGVVPGNLAALEPMHRAGVLGFKAFLTPSGVDEFLEVGIRELELAAREVSRLGSVLLVHAESPAALVPPEEIPLFDPRRYTSWLASRPAVAEAAAIDLLIDVVRRTGASVHVVHLSSAAGLERVRAGRAEGLTLSAESCPHYLTFAAEEVIDGATEWKCAPPIRGGDDREALWRGLEEGSISQVSSDHSPCPPVMKGRASGDFFAAWGGIASLQIALAATWTGATARGCGLGKLAEWMSAAPARIAGLARRKGAIAVGRDADLVVFDPEATFVVDPRALHHRHPVTPYAGRTLSGRVVRTYLRGEAVFDGSRVESGRGLLIASS